MIGYQIASVISAIFCAVAGIFVYKSHKKSVGIT